MSSTIFVKYGKELDRKEWDKFCKENGIRFSPRTIGGNVFYQGDCEVSFHPRLVYVSTYWNGNLENVYETYRIIRKFAKPSSVEYSPEFQYYFQHWRDYSQTAKKQDQPTKEKEKKRSNILKE